ncbi:SsgA family sporulation/cell division regulator [Streptomyces cadmiisoli]|uniref:SsgA family sporulation/cell division regulator n=1 Tax=Streptomyces cadmiisoli TaxID=2184053 RepID=UPI003668D083
MTSKEAFNTHDHNWSDGAGDRIQKADGMQPESARRRSVTCLTLMRLVKADRQLRVATQLRYDSADPCTVSMLFNLHTDTPVEWVVGRELLSVGRYEVSGRGDVRVWPSQHLDGVVFISLRSGAETEVLAASARAIDTFLERTNLLVPPGEEERYLDMDGVVHQLMDGAS